MCLKLTLWRASVVEMRSYNIQGRWQKERLGVSWRVMSLSLGTATILPTGCVWRLGDIIRVDDTTTLGTIHGIIVSAHSRKKLHIIM